MALFSKNKKEKKKSEDSKSKKADEEKLTDDERIEKGQMKVRFIIELLGSPKDIIEKTMVKVMDKLAAEDDVEMISHDIAPLKEQGKLWSTFSECEVWVKSFKAMASILFEYLPSSVEVVAPTQFILRASDISDYLNDMQARLHQTDMVSKNLRTEVDVLKRQAGGMLNNLIVISLSQSPKTLDELSAAIGMESKELDKYVKRFIEHKRVKKEGEVFHLTKSK